MLRESSTAAQAMLDFAQNALVDSTLFKAFLALVEDAFMKTPTVTKELLDSIREACEAKSAELGVGFNSQAKREFAFIVGEWKLEFDVKDVASMAETVILCDIKSRLVGNKLARLPWEAEAILKTQEEPTIWPEDDVITDMQAARNIYRREIPDTLWNSGAHLHALVSQKTGVCWTADDTWYYEVAFLDAIIGPQGTAWFQRKLLDMMPTQSEFRSTQQVIEMLRTFQKTPTFKLFNEECETTFNEFTKIVMAMDAGHEPDAEVLASGAFMEKVKVSRSGEPPAMIRINEFRLFAFAQKSFLGESEKPLCCILLFQIPQIIKHLFSYCPGTKVVQATFF